MKARSSRDTPSSSNTPYGTGTRSSTDTYSKPILLAQAEDAGGGGGEAAPEAPAGPSPGPAPAAPGAPGMPLVMAPPPSTIDPDSPYADLLSLGNGGMAMGNAPPYLIVPYVQLTEILTDNVRHTRTDKLTDLLSVFTAGVTGVADTARLQGSITYSISWRQGIADTRQDRLAQYGYGLLHSTLVQDYLFFDVRAHAAEINRSGLGTPNPSLSTNSEATQVYVVSGSPDFRSMVGDLGFVDLRYTITQVWFSRNTGATVINGIPVGPISDSLHQQGHADFKMPGTINAQLLTDISANTSYTESSRLLGIYRTYSTTLLNEYALTRQFSAIGGVGYEKLSNPRFASLQGEGITFDYGGRWRPNPDSSIMVLYGRHDLKSDIAAQVQYKYSDTTYLYAIYTDAITSTQRGIAGNTANSAFGLDGPYVNSGSFGFYDNPALDELGGGDSFSSGIPLELANSFLSTQNDFFRNKAFRANFHTSIYGETFSINAYHVDSLSLTGLRQPPELTSDGATASWLPHLGGDYTGLLLIGYRETRPSQGQIFNFAAAVNYHFSASFFGTLRYDFIDNLGNTSFPGAKVGGYVVNALTLRLRKTF